LEFFIREVSFKLGLFFWLNAKHSIDMVHCHQLTTYQIIERVLSTEEFIAAVVPLFLWLKEVSPL
jgi:hypothetical protein